MPINKKNKSQVTLFMIVGVVVLLTFLSLFYVFYLNQNKTNQLQNPLNVKNFVQSCVDLVGVKSLEWVFIQGGNYKSGSLFKDIKIYKLAKPIGDIKTTQRNDYNFS